MKRFLQSRLPLRLAASQLLPLVLSACVNVTYAPVAIDSPRPQSNEPTCGSERSELEAGQRCLALVRSDQKYSSTGLKVEYRQAYRITVQPDQVWFDKNRRNQPPWGEPGNSMMALYATTRRVPTSAWFALIGNVVDDKRIEQMPGHDFACATDMQVMKPGTLVLYPNDHEYFYGNNRGQIWVTIERVAPHLPGPVPPADPRYSLCK